MTRETIGNDSFCGAYVKRPDGEIASAIWHASERSPVAVFFDHIADFWNAYDVEQFATESELPIPIEHQQCSRGVYERMDFAEWRNYMLERKSCIFISRSHRFAEMVNLVEPVDGDGGELLVEIETVSLTKLENYEFQVDSIVA